MIDPTQLRQKLRRRNIGPGCPGSMDNALQAVQEREAEVRKFGDSGVTETDKCVHFGILSAEELAYMIHNWAMQWPLSMGVPE